MRVNALRFVFCVSLGAALAVAGLLPGAARADEASRTAIEQDYLKSSSPELLYKLGVLAQSEGRSADAIDFFRRYLADPQSHPDEPAGVDAKKRLRELSAKAGELLISGDSGALISVDDMLRGVLPLTLPLYLAVGEHAVTVRSGAKILTSKVTIEHGRRSEMRFESSDSAVVVSNPPPVVVLTTAELLPAELQPSFGNALDRSVSRAGLAPFLTSVALSRVSESCSPPASFDCQERVLRKSRVDFVLAVQLAAVTPAGNNRFAASVRLFDSPVGELAASDERTIEVGAAKGWSELSQLLDRVLATGMARPRGTLRLASIPVGAEVYIGGRAIGVTPLVQPAWAEPLDVELRLRGYRSEQRRVTIAEQQPTTLEVTLQAAPIPPSRRPRWRIAAGIAAVAVGFVMINFGIAGLAIHDRCIAEPMPPQLSCGMLYDTKAPGSALVVVGAGFTLAGTLLIAWPPKKGRH